jgi:heme exporter protein D
MGVHFSFWTFAMFTFNVLVVPLGFGLTLRSHRQILEELKQQAARHEVVWQKLFTKANNTERLTQEIFMRLANEKQAH